MRKRRAAPPLSAEFVRFTLCGTRLKHTPNKVKSVYVKAAGFTAKTSAIAVYF